MKVSRGEVTMNYVILVAFAIFALTPVITILLTSVAPPLGESGGIHLDNFARAWTVGGFGRSLGNSVVVAVIVVGLSLMLSRSEEHTSELQSRGHLVCRLLLEKNKER